MPRGELQAVLRCPACQRELIVGEGLCNHCGCCRSCCLCRTVPPSQWTGQPQKADAPTAFLEEIQVALEIMSVDGPSK